MRYLKVFGLVLVFFLVMMFFVQNQASFADPVVLHFDPLFVSSMESMPLPLYAIMLICFAMGAGLVLLMLMWDRMSISSRLTIMRRKAVALEKKTQRLEAEVSKATQDAADAKAKHKEELDAAEARVKAALRSVGAASPNAIE